MTEALDSFDLLRHLTWQDVFIVFAVLILASFIVVITRWATRNAAEKVPPRYRMAVLRAKPIIRLVISIITLAVVIQILIEPSFNNLIILFSSVALVVGFAFKDYEGRAMGSLIRIDKLFVFGNISLNNKDVLVMGWRAESAVSICNRKVDMLFF